MFENGQTELEIRECEEKEIMKDIQTTVDQETQYPLDPENFHIKNEDDSSAGEVAILKSVSQVCFFFKCPFHITMRNYSVF